MGVLSSIEVRFHQYEELSLVAIDISEPDAPPGARTVAAYFRPTGHRNSIDTLFRERVPLIQRFIAAMERQGMYCLRDDGVPRYVYTVLDGDPVALIDAAYDAARKLT